MRTVWLQSETTIKGRGAATPFPHRFESLQREVQDDGWPRDDEPSVAHPPTQVELVQAGQILSRNHSPDIPFELAINPYRGCEHGCIYCYARPTHSYLNLSPGLDFETRLFAKMDAPQALRTALASQRYMPRSLCIGSATDAYQPIERRLRLTRGLIEVLAECRHPFLLITKSSAVERDVNLLASMAEFVSVQITLTTLDPELARRLEPRASSPQRRLLTIRRLTEAGLAVGVSVSPIIPFVNEPELERILGAAREAGAVEAWTIPLRLPWEVAPLFEDWLRRHLPDRADRVLARLRDLRGGRLNDARFGSRFRGEGIWADLLRQRFDKACGRLGLSRRGREPDFSQFRRPAAGVSAQAELF